jgi:hypothetical protein
MTVHTGHAIAVVHIWSATVVAGEFRINPSAVTKGAGLGFVFANEIVAGEKSSIYARDHGAFYMAIAAGSVAAPTGLFEDLFIEGILFLFGEAAKNAISHAGTGVMEGKTISGAYILMADAACIDIVGWSFYKARVSLFLAGRISIAFVAE